MYNNVVYFYSVPAFYCVCNLCANTGNIWEDFLHQKQVNGNGKSKNLNVTGKMNNQSRKIEIAASNGCIKIIAKGEEGDNEEEVDEFANMFKEKMKKMAENRSTMHTSVYAETREAGKSCEQRRSTLLFNLVSVLLRVSHIFPLQIHHLLK